MGKDRISSCCCVCCFVLQFLVIFVLWSHDSIALLKKGWIVSNLCHKINELLIDVEKNKTRDFGGLVYFSYSIVAWSIYNKIEFELYTITEEGMF